MDYFPRRRNEAHLLDSDVLAGIGGEVLRQEIVNPLASLGTVRPKLLLQSLQCPGFFQWIQIFPLDVFNEGHGGGLFVADLPDHSRDPLQAGNLCRPPAPFAGDEFIATLGSGPKYHRQRFRSPTQVVPERPLPTNP